MKRRNDRSSHLDEMSECAWERGGGRLKKQPCDSIATNLFGIKMQNCTVNSTYQSINRNTKSIDCRTSRLHAKYAKKNTKMSHTVSHKTRWEKSLLKCTDIVE